MKRLLNLKIEDKESNESIKRAYSIASPPNKEGFIELCVKLVENGKLTPKLWEKKVGDIVELHGPFGMHTAEKIEKNKILFIATGTGIAPHRSMILDQLEKETQKQITLLLGVRYEENILYGGEFRFLQRSYPNFNFVPIISRPSQEWEGRRGYVQNNLENLDPFETQVFICGLSEMVEEVKKKLIDYGFDQNDIIMEKYD